jgi:hypothetical protein
MYAWNLVIAKFGHAFGFASLMTSGRLSRRPVSRAFTAPGTWPVDT